MLIAGATAILVAGLGAFEVYLASRSDAVVAGVLGGFTRYSIVWPSVVAVLAFEFASAPRLLGMEEPVSACADSGHQHWLAMMVPPALLVATVFAIYLMLKVAVIAVTHQWNLLLPHVVLEAILNVLVPSSIGMFLGVAIARRLSRYAGYAAIVAFVLLIGPYSEVVPFLAQMAFANGGTGVDLYPVYDLFKVLAPDATWGMDSLYGFPLEPERWVLAAFWILSLLVAVLPAVAGPRVRRIRHVRIAVAALAAVSLAIVLLPSNELRRDFRLFGGSSVVSNQEYYQFQISKHPQQQLAADFKVSRYQMQLAADRQLRGRVSVDIVDDEHVDEYHFTLYHDYRVSEVLDSQGTRVDFVQDGDYLTVLSAEKETRLTFEYSGTGGISIANSQCVYLPGDFPYYPVPGFTRIWDEYRLGISASLADRTPADFSVEFDAGVPLASNLGERNGVFEGRTVAPSFVGGLLAQQMVGNRRVVFYPAGGADPQQLVRTFARLRELERYLGVEESRVKDDVTVIQMPGFTQSSYAAVVLPDTLLLTGFMESDALHILVATMPARLDRENLKQAFTRFIDDPEAYKQMVGEEELPTHGHVASLERSRLVASSDTNRVQEYCYPAASAVNRLFLEMILADGEAAALRNTYQFLISTDPMSELEFLTQGSDGEVQ